MRDIPSNRLNPKIKTAWRINALIFCVFVGGLVLLAAWSTWFSLSSSLGSSSAGASVTYGILIGCAIGVAVYAIVTIFVLPPIRYIRWRFEVGVDELDILKGIIWKQRIIIPLVRVQNVDTKQGPVLRMCNLESVTVSTAAGSHEIPGLSAEEAGELRDKVAMLARLAQEDV